MAKAHLSELDTIMQLARTALVPFQMCPLALFAEVIRINHLRRQATKYANQGAGVRDMFESDGHAILQQIQLFSPDEWADTKPRCRQDWIVMGNVYQAAVAVYCISSLQSVSVLPTSSSLRAECAAHVSMLYQSLLQAVISPRTNRFTLWPLVVLGVEAVYEGSGAVRDFVASQLPALSCHVGTFSPLTAKTLLETFWASGETSWDACFDRPYAFFTHIAVDTSRILMG